MKKNLFILFACTAIILGCSKSEDEEPDIKIPEKKVEYKLSKVDLVGLWRGATDQNVAFSFSSDKLFSGLLDNYTIDDGDYFIEGDTVKINNSYLGYNIRFSVSSVKDDQITGILKYNALTEKGNLHENTKVITLVKTTEPPCERKNKLIGKSFSRRTSYGNDSKYNFSVIQYNIMTYTFTSYATGQLKHSGIAHYIYIPPKIYFTVYDDYGVSIHLGQDVLNVRTVNFDKNGQVSITQQ